MFTQEKLHSLAEISCPDCPLVSIYLNCDQTDEKQLEKTRIFLDNSFNEIEKGLGSSKNKESFGKDKEKIKEEFEAMLGSSKKGLVIFACSKQGVWEVFKSPVKMENDYYIGSFAFLLPLIRVNEEFTRTACILLDSRKSLIYLITQGETEKRLEEEHYFPDRVDAGGWSQMRYQRHIEEHLKDNFKKVYESLEDAAGKKPVDHLILAGPKELRKKFEKMLSKSWQKKQEKGFSADSEIKENELVAKITQIREESEREEEKDITKELFDSQKGRTTLENVLRAVNRDKVYLLAIDRDFSHPGYLCEETKMLYAQKEDCPEKKEDLKKIDLKVALVRQAVLQGAKVEIVSENQDFKKQGGVGVIVRY